MSMTLPPVFYDNDVLSTWYSLMANSGWMQKYVDINFTMNINYLISNYMEKIHYNARKNLKIAEESGLIISECKSLDDRKKAYRTIKINRETKGYLLRMTEEQVMNTINIVPASMYGVYDNSEMVASALVYDVTDSVAQVVYWGDIPGYQEKKVINFLAYELLKIYADKGFQYLDIGPSTEKGIPKYGLCDFKDSIGCSRTVKHYLYKDL